MTPGNTGPSNHYARYLPQAYKDAIIAAFNAGAAAERARSFGNYDGEQAASKSIEEHIDSMLPVVKEYGAALDSALRLLDVSEPQHIPALEEVPKERLMYLPADWTSP